jgi:hypothetical protein
MNNEIAGKIISDVKGFEDVRAAVAKELKATRRGIPLQRAIFQDYLWHKHINKTWCSPNTPSQYQSSLASSIPDYCGPRRFCG